MSEAEIRHRCGYEAVGMQLGKIANGLSDLPVIVEYQIDWGLHDLRDCARHGGFPIVSLDLRPVDGRYAFHAVIVADVRSDRVVVYDPLQVTESTIGWSTFDAAWSAADREAVIITASKAIRLVL